MRVRGYGPGARVGGHLHLQAAADSVEGVRDEAGDDGGELREG